MVKDSGMFPAKLQTPACWAPVALLLAAFLTAHGCSSKKEPVVTEPEPAATAAPKPKKTAKPQPAKKSEAAPKSASDSGRKMVGDIPLDVWFDDPLAIARNNTPTGGAAPAIAANAPTATPTAPPPKPAAGAGEMASAAGAGGGDWKSVISGEEINSEAKKIRLRLKDGLQSVGKYNGHYKEMRIDGAVLAALAQIAGAHPDSISWKDDAKYVRDISSELSSSAKGLAQANYDPTKAAFEKLDSLLLGNKPPDLAEAASTVPFSEIASRSYLMGRIDRGYNWLKSNINNEETFKKEKDAIIQEASVLAALGKVIGSEGYDAYDEEDYQKLIQDFIKANLDVVNAAKNDSYPEFDSALGRSAKSCTECHMSYRNS